VLDIPLRQGRLFGREDRLGGPPVVLINESMAARFWPRGGAVGARVRLGPDPSSPLIEVAGIVGDVRNDRLRADAAPMVYASTRQNPAPILRVLLRATADPTTLVKPVEQVLSSLDASLPLQQPMMLSTVLGRGLATRRLPVALMTGFGVMALLLAVVGVYAMFASMTASREREFGVRIALGAPRAAVAALVLRQGAGWMIAGLAGGALGVMVVVRLVAELLYGVSAFDPLTLGAVVGVLAGCATLALLVPLRRATRVNPASALRAQ
jgi:putative ABC transport system permease protein